MVKFARSEQTERMKTNAPSYMYKHFYLERVGEASEIPARARAAGLFGAS
jgi:hypothetical protein